MPSSTQFLKSRAPISVLMFCLAWLEKPGLTLYRTTCWTSEPGKIMKEPKFHGRDLRPLGRPRGVAGDHGSQKLRSSGCLRHGRSFDRQPSRASHGLAAILETDG